MRLRKIKKGELPEVRIHWIDACGPSNMETFTREEALRAVPLEMWDYGVLLGFNNERTAYVLASNFSSEGLFRRLMVIPIEYVVKLEVLGYMYNECLGI